MAGCLTLAVEWYKCAAIVTVERKLISSVETSCNLALQELNKTVILKIPFLPNSTFHKVKLHTAKISSILILSLQYASTIRCVLPRMGHPSVLSSW